MIYVRRRSDTAFPYRHLSAFLAIVCFSVSAKVDYIILFIVY